MPNKHHYRLNAFLGAATLCCGIFVLSITMLAQRNVVEGDNLQGLLLPSSKRGEAPWKTISEEQIAYGYTVPKNTHAILKFPKSFIRINRNTVFGEAGTKIRYWGYCFAETAEETGLSALPGTFFMSEAENDAIIAEEREKMRLAVKRGTLTEANLNLHASNNRRIRSEKDEFYPGEVCYIMTQEPLAIGLDPDNDLANNRIERKYKTLPDARDSDGDGVIDGFEIHRLGTMPLVRDTDGDGLIDGMEDKNRNGKTDFGETSPLNGDSDADELCDGYCRVDKGRSVAGEDLNLNGVVDDDETDPLKRDTDGDGVFDEQEFFLCQLQGKLGGNCN